MVSVRIQITQLVEKIRASQYKVENQATLIGQLKSSDIAADSIQDAVDVLKVYKNENSIHRQELRELKENQQFLSPLEAHGPRVNKEHQPFDMEMVKSDLVGIEQFDGDVKNMLLDGCSDKSEGAHLLRNRGFILGHRDLGQALRELKTDPTSCYVLTNIRIGMRGMNIGHSVPISVCAFLQREFGVKVVIEIADDELYYIEKKPTMAGINKRVEETILDVLSHGFDIENTFIFSNYGYCQKIYRNNLRVMKTLSIETAMDVYSLNLGDYSSFVPFLGTPIAATFGSSFPHLNLDKKRCIAVYTVNMDGCYTTARDIAIRLNETPAATLVCNFVPSMSSNGSCMVCEESKDNASTILFSNTPKQIQKKINSSFSGGQETAELQKELGGNTSVDVACSLINIFEPSDEVIGAAFTDYSSGQLLTGQIKKMAIDAVKKYVLDMNEMRKKITPADIEKATAFT